MNQSDNAEKKVPEEHVLPGDDVRVVLIVEMEIPFSSLKKGDKFRAYKTVNEKPKNKPMVTKGVAVRGPGKELYFEALDQVDLVQNKNQISTFSVRTKPIKDRPQHVIDYSKPPTSLNR